MTTPLLCSETLLSTSRWLLLSVLDEVVVMDYCDMNKRAYQHAIYRIYHKYPSQPNTKKSADKLPVNIEYVMNLNYKTFKQCMYVLI